MSAETVEVDANISSVTVEEKEDDCLPKLCSICKTGFDKVVPKLLPCLHSFCQACLEDRLKDQQPSTTALTSNHRASSSRLKCPKCGQEFLVPSRGVSSLIDNQFILEIVTKPSGENETEQHICTSCEDNSSASSYCLNCSEWLCDACVQAHQRVRVTKDHEIKSGDDLRASVRNHGRNERSLYCQKHPSEKLKLFCIKCERLTCRDCQLLEHKDHQYQFVNEAASRYREFFKKRLKTLEEKIGPLAESIEAVQNSSTHLDHKSEVVANEIKNSSSDIIKAVKQRENVLLNELQALVHFKRKMLTKQTKDLNLMQDILKHNYEFTKHAVYQGSDVSLLTSQRQLGSRIQNLLSLKYRVTPVAHSDLKFVTEAVKLCNAILKAGSVMTPSSQRSSLSPANINRNPNLPPHHNGNHSTSTMKVNPMLSLNAFTNHHGIQAATGINPKPSSKVYPNVITSQMAMSVVQNGMQTTVSVPFSEMRNPHTLSKPHSSSVPVPIPSNFPLSSQIPGVPSRRLANPGGSGIPLRHVTNGNDSVSSSPPSYEVSLHNVRRSSSSAVVPEITSPQTSHPGNNVTSLSRDIRRDNLISSRGMEPASLLSSTSPKLNLSSPSPLSPGLPKPSPNPSHSSMSPSQSSPRPLVSPKSIHAQPSPIPSPLPTFLDSEFREATGIRIKTEKDLSPQGMCSLVKPEPGLHKSCRGNEMPGPCACDPPSNNSTNDDWCAVCHNGGELLCCDTCPRVFHLNCHVPVLTSTPSDSWNCGLCESLDARTRKLSDTGKRRGLVCGMSERDTKRCEKMLLALFCHPDSVPFHDKVSKAVPNYYKVIQRPMDLTLIKTKLQPVHFEHYDTVDDFIADCKLIFSNCARFNDAESEVGKMGQRLAAEFQNIVQRYSDEEHEDNAEPAAKRRRDESI